jgi:coenzyme F420 hydrogenase subunit beta
MGIDAAGYARPLQNAPLEPSAEAMIAAACPGHTVAPWPRDAGEDMQWGPHRDVMTGYATDSALRQSASSGGGISALAIHVLQAGLVDAVVQTGVDPADPTRTVTRISDSTETVAASVGSRYGPSSPLSDFTSLLEDPRRFAFIGKPCDVSALRSLAKVDARVNERFPIMLSFFCAGIPSLKGTDQILADLGIARADLADFKYRGDGWPGYATATRHDGSTERMSYEDSWGGRLSKVVQFRCKICPDAVGGSADVACADAWYGDENGYPTFEETDGRSLMITRTAAGKALVDAARAEGIVATEPVPIRDIDKMQPSQARRKRLIASRLVAMAVTFQPLLAPKGVGIAATARTAGVGETVKSFLGLIRRIVQGRK